MRDNYDLSTQPHGPDISSPAFVPPFSLLAPPGGGGGGAGVFPFDVTKTNSTHFTVRTGTVNGLVPSNIATTFVMAGSGTEYVVLKVTTTDAEVTAAEIMAPTPTTPPPAMPVGSGQPPSIFYVLLAVLVDGTPFRTFGNGSVTAVAYEVYRLQKAMLTPDALPYDSYYSWRTSVT